MIWRWILRQRVAATLSIVLAMLTPPGFADDGAVLAEKSESQSSGLSLPYLSVMLARDPAVQAELGLDAKQQAAISAAVADVDLPMWQLRDVPADRSAGKLDPLLAQFRRRLSAGLRGSQLARLDQLILRAQGIQSLLSAANHERLMLSADQTKQLTDVLQASRRERTATVQEKLSAAERRQAESDLDAREMRHFSQLLSTEQQERLKVLIGAPFNFGAVRRIGALAPELRGIEAWLGSKPLKLNDLRGRVVILHFWAFGCINCVRNLPHYQAWHERFPANQLTIIGVHTPETATERNIDNLQRNIVQRQIGYPVAVDTNAETWKAWANHTWPAVYVIDRHGQIRAWWYGELNWQGATGEATLRDKIDQLLAED